MWGITTVVAAFMLAVVAMSLSFSGGGAIVAVPLAIVAIATVGFVDLRRRRRQAETLREHRDQAQAEKIDFTARDRETLTSE